MMSKKIIYAKQYPKWEMPNEEELKTIESPTDQETEHLTFEQIIEKIYKDVVFVLMPERAEKAKFFIRKAIAVSELYELDIKIEQHFSHITANYYFDCGGAMKYLIDIIKEADEIAFFRPKEGCDLIMSLDFYTHAEYRNGRQVEP